MDLGTLLKDKRLLAGMGLAAAVGLGVMVQRKKSTGSTGTSDSLTGSTQYVQGGTLDTTATDISSFLSNYSQGLQGQLDEYGKSLGSAVDAISKLQSTTTTTDTSVTTPTTTTTTTTPASNTWTLPRAMTARQAAEAIFGGGAASAWNGGGGRLYWGNESTIVNAARAGGYNDSSKFYDSPLPAGTVLKL